MTIDVPNPPRPRADRTWRDAANTPLMVELSGGGFQMGETNDDKFANDTERPVHEVVLAEGFSLGCFPVTVGEFHRFHPGHAPDDGAMLPVVQVNWHEARAYCEWLTENTGRTYRLPSEAEWEFACRAGSRCLFGWGDEITLEAANFLYDENGIRVGAGHRLPVENYPPNAFGLHDLHGNICEWVADTWHPNYIGAPFDGSPWTDPEEMRHVVRGGAWDYMPRLLRSAWRDWRLANERTDNIGFRVATSGWKNTRGCC
jgi:formylglycine-generating enzyme required for sulfatase activity